MKGKTTFYVKLVKPRRDKEQVIFIIDAKDAFEAVKTIHHYTGVYECDRIEAYPYHGQIYYPRELR